MTKKKQGVSGIEEKYKNLVIRRKKEVSQYIVEGFTATYSPYSWCGVSVLDKPSEYIFNLIDDKKTTNDLYLEAKKKDKFVTFSDIHNILVQLADISTIEYGGAEKKNHLTAQPRQFSVWFHMTNQCNLRCTYCYVSKTSHAMSDEIAQKIITKLLIDSKKNRFKELRLLFSGGECLLEFERIKRLVAYGYAEAKKINIRILFVILTNGVLITEKVAKFIKENHIGVGVSLDGLNSFHDSQRYFKNGMGSFLHVEKGIKMLMKFGVVFSVTITVTSRNVKHLPELTRYCVSNKIPFYINLYRENECAPNDVLAVDEDILIPSLKESLKYVYKNISNKSLNVLDMLDLLDMMSVSRSALRACGVGGSYITVSHEGKLASCPMTISEPIGTIEDKDVVQTMKKKSFIVNTKPIIDEVNECKTCPWRHACCGGCPLSYYTEKGRYKVPKYCRTYKEIVPEMIKLKAKRLIMYRENSLN